MPTNLRKPDANTQTFRKVHKHSDQTHRQFLHDMTKVFNRWLHSNKVNRFETLKELILFENFLWKIKPREATFLREKRVHGLNEAETKADDVVVNQIKTGFPFPKT